MEPEVVKPKTAAGREARRTYYKPDLLEETGLVEAELIDN
jgi:hypothetical protein